MKLSKDKEGLHRCEMNVIQSYDDDFAALYRCVWDPNLGGEQQTLLDDLFPEGAMPDTVFDAAAGTGELAVRLAGRGGIVTANELSPSMRRYVRLQKEANSLADGVLTILEPGICWRNLPTEIGGQRFGLVICIGAALAHCDNSPSGILGDSLAGLASLVAQGGYLVVDCKRYAEDGIELQCDGTKRPLEVTDRKDVEWIDLHGRRRSGELRSSFSLSQDRSLIRAFHYQETTGNEGYQREWAFRVWPVAKLEVGRILESCGMRLVRERVLDGPRRKLPVDNLLFRKERQP